MHGLMSHVKEPLAPPPSTPSDLPLRPSPVSVSYLITLCQIAQGSL